MYIHNFKEMYKYKNNIIISLFGLFFCLGISGKYIPNAVQIQKGILLLFCIIMIIKLGVDKKYLKNFIVFLIVSVVSFVLAEQDYAVISYKSFIMALLGLSLFYIILLVNIGSHIRSIATAIVFLPAFMVILSIIIYFSFNIPLISSGSRYGAGLSNAHFGFLMYFVVLFICYDSLVRNKMALSYFFLAILLLLWSGSRGPLVAAFIPSLLLVKFIKTKNLQRKLIFITPPALYVIGFFIQSIIDRSQMATFDREGDINLSGREFAWDYFLNKIEGVSLFGGKLGSITKVTEGITEYNLYLFTVPHNEFIRFYMELGVIGCSVFFLNLFMIFRYTYIICRPESKRFMRYMFVGFLLITLFDNSLSTIQSILPLAILLKYIHFIEVQENDSTAC